MSASKLPTGIVTFLYTDIEGSTSLWEQMPEAMRRSLALHDEILRQAITTNQGHTYKIIGDAFQAAFAEPIQAVAAAVEAQRRLAAASWNETGPLRVRMGLHTGDALALEDDYDTTHTLNRVARIMAAGHGGQILASETVANLVRDSLKDGLTLQNMGQHRMKGLSQPEHLYQLQAPDLEQEFPPLRTLSLHLNNLPVQVTPFLGRTQEIAAVQEMFSSNRLLTLTGPGGMGKTRLSQQVAANLIDSFPDGIWYVELAPLSDSKLIDQAVALAIGLREPEGSRTIEVIVNYLQPKQSLLILDNCEHVIDGCAQFSQEILQTSPQVKILATSRETLNLAVEQVFSLSGFDLPESNQLGEIDHPAVRLFVQNAQRLAADFELQPDDLEAVIRICRHVQGMPLAIMLAAGWTDVMSVEEIAAEIAHGLDILETEFRDVPERQRSMRATFEYSWQLLSDQEQAALARMSVFRGGFDRRAAQTITGSPIRLLSKLVNKSLIQRDKPTQRYQVHELIRQFSHERLAKIGEYERVRDVHSHHYLTKLAQAESNLKGERQLDTLEEIEADFENIRSAWQWAVEQQNEKLVNGAVEALFLFTNFRNHYSEGRELFQQARKQWPAHLEPASELAGRLLLRYPEESPSPREIFEQALAIARGFSNPADIAYARNQLGRYLAHSGTDRKRGLALLEQSLADYRGQEDGFSEARVLDDIAFAYSQTTQEKRIAYGRQSLALRRQIGDKIGMAQVLRNLTIASYSLGLIQESRNYTEEAIAIARQTNEQSGLGWMLSIHAEFLFLKGHVAESEQVLEEALAISWDINDVDLISNNLAVKGLFVAVLEGDYAAANELMLQSSQLGANTVMLWWTSTVQALISCGLADFAEARRFILYALEKTGAGGAGLSAYPHLLPAIVFALSHYERPSLAVECLGYFDNMADDVTIWAQDWQPLKKARADLKSQLGLDNYQAALERGKLLNIQTLTTEFEKIV